MVERRGAVRRPHNSADPQSDDDERKGSTEQAMATAYDAAGSPETDCEQERLDKRMSKTLA